MLRNAAIAFAWVTVVTASAIAQQTLIGSKAGEIRDNPRDGEQYVGIPPGTISHGFWIGQTEVTVGAYRQLATATRIKMPPESDLG